MAARTGLKLAKDIYEAFKDLCCRADQSVGWPGAVEVFLSWFDETPWDQVRRELAGEIRLNLARRAAGQERGPETLRVA